MVSQIKPEQVAEKLTRGEAVYLLDVRQPWEAEYCQIANSVLIPLPELPTRVSEVQPSEGSSVVVYCHHGVRSLSGAAILMEAGFKDVASMMGGIDRWSAMVDPKVPRY